uniref:Uncharacterized protein ORFp n=1 Tax=Pseudomonas chlororaphis TaxID=333 RepID=Q9L3W3_PSECL|nr:hypothetical protein [Pseudomonas chlororaphis]
MTASNSHLLEASGLQAAYGSSHVLFGIDLKIQRGQVVTLLGRNGMGKTTTIRSLVGALPLKGGTIRFNGRETQALRADAVARLGVAFVPEGRHCFPNLTVEEHLIAFASVRNEQAEPWTVPRLYELFPRLKARARNFGNQLSGGEQQMLAIARALSTNPRLLILDEATEGLAPILRQEIWHCLELLRKAGQTILIVDKYVERLLKLADRHLIVERGKVVWEGSSSALDRDRALWTRYLGV